MHSVRSLAMPEATSFCFLILITICLTSKFGFIALKGTMQALNKKSASLRLLLYWRDCENAVCYEQGPMVGGRTFRFNPPVHAHNVMQCKVMHV